MEAGESSSEEEEQSESYDFEFSLVPSFIKAVKQAIAWKEKSSQPSQKIGIYFPNLKYM